MKNRLFITMIAVLSLLAVACGSGTEVATEPVEGSEETAEVAEAETTTSEAPETSTTAPESTEAPTETTTEAPPDTEPAADQTTTPAPSEAEEEPEAGEVDAAAIDGMAIYESNCARCHSSDGSGGRGANIQGISEEQPETTGGIEIVTNGSGGMPTFADDLTPEEIEAVVNYVWETF